MVVTYGSFSQKQTEHCPHELSVLHMIGLKTIKRTSQRFSKKVKQFNSKKGVSGQKLYQLKVVQRFKIL